MTWATHMTVSDVSWDRLWGMVPVSWLCSSCSDIMVPGDRISTSGSGPSRVLFAKSLHSVTPPHLASVGLGWDGA